MSFKNEQEIKNEVERQYNILKKGFIPSALKALQPRRVRPSKIISLRPAVRKTLPKTIRLQLTVTLSCQTVRVMAARNV